MWSRSFSWTTEIKDDASYSVSFSNKKDFDLKLELFTHFPASNDETFFKSDRQLLKNAWLSGKVIQGPYSRTNYDIS